MILVYSVILTPLPILQLYFMKNVKVDPKVCIGCGMCESIAEEVFELNSEGISIVRLEAKLDNEEIKKKTIEAKDMCPVGAIITEE